MAKNSIFNSDNWLWKPFSWVADVFLLSALWLLSSVPLVTMGAATAAAYDTAARCVRGTDRAFFARYFRTFKREWKSATVLFLFWAAIVAGAFGLVKLFGNSVAVTDGSVVLTVAGLLLVAVVLGVACWVLPIQSRFTMSFGAVCAAAARLALGNMPRTMVLGILTALCGWLCLQFWIPFLFLPGILLLLWTVLLEPVFRKFEETEE